MRPICQLLLSACLFTLGIASVESAAPAARFETGEVFPNLVLPSLEDGRPVSLAQFRGKKIILHIFASW